MSNYLVVNTSTVPHITRRLSREDLQRAEVVVRLDDWYVIKNRYGPQGLSVTILHPESPLAEDPPQGTTNPVRPGAPWAF